MSPICYSDEFKLSVIKDNYANKKGQGPDSSLVSCGLVPSVCRLSNIYTIFGVPSHVFVSYTIWQSILIYGGIKMTTFGSFQGTLIMINDFFTSTGELIGCNKLMTVQNSEGDIVNFVITPATYFVNHAQMKIGYTVIGFYDANAPVPLIFPPQYQAIVMSRLVPDINVKVDYFDNQLVSSDGTLKLNLTPFTQIILENDQFFTNNPANRNLIIVYGPTTRSIPAQTTPYQIIVICPKV